MSTLLSRLLTPGDVAKLLRTTSTRVIRLARAKVIPCVEMPGGELLFSQDDLSRWIDSRKSKPGGGHRE